MQQGIEECVRRYHGQRLCLCTQAVAYLSRPFCFFFFLSSYLTVTELLGFEPSHTSKRGSRVAVLQFLILFAFYSQLAYLYFGSDNSTRRTIILITTINDESLRYSSWHLCPRRFCVSVLHRFDMLSSHLAQHINGSSSSNPMANSDSSTTSACTITQLTFISFNLIPTTTIYATTVTATSQVDCGGCAFEIRDLGGPGIGPVCHANR